MGRPASVRFLQRKCSTIFGRNAWNAPERRGAGASRRGDARAAAPDAVDDDAAEALAEAGGDVEAAAEIFFGSFEKRMSAARLVLVA